MGVGAGFSMYVVVVQKFTFARKCQVVTFRRSVDKSYKYTILDCNNQTIPLERGIQVLDLGVCMF